ncbi:MAG: phosphatase PAP2 family protein, partial [Gammaproteobacteria bacterium]|nr:phosphatase PAP2 family protein [Gammaproteobacteria bacterium]
FAVTGLDEPVSEWASKTNPIFGSQQAADNASDEINYILSDAAAITTLATPSGDSPGSWLYAKTKGVAVHALARGFTSRVTISLKKQMGRERPDGSDNLSLPSGHTTQAYASATLAVRNLDSIQLSERSRRITQLGIKTMAATTAWARVEAKRHYPSDVLAGAALAHFLNLVIHDAFMWQQENSFVTVAEGNDGTLIRVTWRY